MKPHIQVIIGSTRPTRTGGKIANWFMDQIKDNQDATFELIDLAEVNLPLLNEPMSASMQKYEYDYTKEWSKTISKADGYIWVTHEYNHSTSAALKNAIDYLYVEWGYKPVGFVGYCTLGGGRAIEHLVGIASQLNMVPMVKRVSVLAPWVTVSEDGKVDATSVIGDPNAMVSETAQWAVATKSLRA